jgi:lipase ATG15
MASAPMISLDLMHPRSLLLTIALYLSATLCTSEEVVFTAQLGFQQPFEIQDQLSKHIQFIPSPPISSTLKSRPTTVYRPRSLDALHNARLCSLQHAQSAIEQPVWDPFEVEGPDVEDLHTLAQLARMSGNAYALPGQKNWYDVDQAWNNVSLFFVYCTVLLRCIHCS